MAEQRLSRPASGNIYIVLPRLRVWRTAAFLMVCFTMSLLTGLELTFACHVVLRFDLTGKEGAGCVCVYAFIKKETHKMSVNEPNCVSVLQTTRQAMTME